ncbi:MAG: hypothetical protein ACFFCS_06610 [Candidatus Hodarchaeota archaeon]
MFQDKKLSHFIKNILPENFPERKNLTELIKILPETCVPIRRLLEKGVSSHQLSHEFHLDEDETQEGTNPSGEDQIHEDQLTHSIFAKTIQESEIPFAFLISEEADPIFGKGVLGITIDPVDGSSNVAVNRTVGTIISIWLQEEIVASLYILYGIFTNMVLAINGRVTEFLLNQDHSSVNFNHFVYMKDLKMPNVGNGGYRCIGGNMDKWDLKFHKFHDELIKRKYKDRYSGAFVGDCHSIIYKGGVYGYLPAPKGKLRLYYEWMPMAYIFETLGGTFKIITMEDGEPVINDSSTVTPLLKSNVLDLAHAICGGIIGNKKSVAILEEIINKQELIP